LSVLRVPLLPKLLYYVTFLIFNSSIPPTAIIGKGSRFAYGGIGVVIHSRARIGERVVIGQGITIGGRSHSPEVPIIGDGAYLGAGSRILGAITIGAGSVVAPNAVVIADVPPRSIVGGVPARILKRDIDAADYV
jgi:serine O-acetyltransferase